MVRDNLLGNIHTMSRGAGVALGLA